MNSQMCVPARINGLRGTLLCLTLLFAGMGTALVPTANANDKLDCLDNVTQLGYAAQFNIELVPLGPTEASDPSEQAAVDAELQRQLAIKRALGIRIWVAFWNYDAGLFSRAQFALNSFEELLDSLVNDGLVDLSAAGQPDFDSLGSAANACVNNPPEPLSTGLQTMQSSGVEREYYLQLPADYPGSANAKPLLFAYHGYTGSYENWIGDSPYYDLVDVVGDGAIIVVPQGLPDASGDRVWGGEDDLNFFVDMLAELEARGLEYDTNQLFVAGHSNGAGFSHELGCRYGDIIRAVVAAAGTLTSTDCTGSVAFLLFQGSNDTLTTINIARGGLGYWILYNGWDPDASGPSALGPCVDYSVPEKPDNLPYPVLWCEHTQGHSWPDFGSTTAWQFLQSLPTAAPTADAPPGGGSEVATPPRDAWLSFQISAPAGMARPLAAAATLRNPSFIDNPTCSIPDVFLNSRFSVDGLIVPGQVSDQITIPITYFVFGGALTFPSDWALALTIYVEGGSAGSIPTPGVDYDVVIPVTLVDRNTDIVIDQVLTIAPAADLCGF